jgi:hypothetical protein
MEKKTCLSIVLLMCLFTSGIAWAECSCVCMNGENQPLCTNTLEIAPICPPVICPIENLSIAPIASPDVPPVGTQECKMEQVYNEHSQQYEWIQVCR